MTWKKYAAGLSNGKWVSTLTLINKRKKLFFSRKLLKLNHPSLTCNGTCVTQSETQKHLEILLDSKLDFKEHI